ncbi:MAG TPA: right-handed parallel beta-helix repeat-containing protein [Thermoguttaceae bacterium]|nr:right-handed parallel beta-helix repeat-containing protein [Thermoguttaceae bacterium]
MIRTSMLALVACLMVLPHSAEPAEFYVDPVHGDIGNDGSPQKPWRSIQAVFDQGLVESRQWAKLPYRGGAKLVPKNAGAPVRAGDTMYLRSGYHGALEIRGYYNSDWITIAAEKGHTPKLSRIRIRSGARWKLHGLHVSPELAGSFERGTLIDLDWHGFHGPVHDIVVEKCRAESVQDSSNWTVQDWNALACNGIQVDGRDMTVRDCTFRNVDFGISVTAVDCMIEGNTVENFAGDGMRGLGDNTTFQYNTVRNCYDVNRNHDDGFQSWSRGDDGRVGTGEVKGIVLRGNTIVNYEDPQQPHRGTLQGIGCFDGTFVDWVVENNVVVTDHYHGITLSGARDCRIVNNTVIDRRDGRPGPPWIRIGSHKNGTPSSGCVVRNNLTTSLNVGDGVTADHNLIIKDPQALFVDVAAFDLRLRSDCEAIDAGSPDLAPSHDAAGTPRPQGEGIDVGAYEHPAGAAATPRSY